MIKDEDLLACFLCYGRGPVQDFITRSHNIRDTLQYLQMERGFEMFRLTSFVTKDRIAFEKKENSLWSSRDRIPGIRSEATRPQDGASGK